MKMIVGLGNPGKEYENTKHNLGFMFLSFLEEKIEFIHFGVCFAYCLLPLVLTKMTECLFLNVLYLKYNYLLLTQFLNER